MDNSKLIYIIDDDPITVFGIRKVLETIISKDNIKTFVNGKNAIVPLLEILKNNERLPDIIFLDLNMPIMDGWQFLEQFIALPIKQNTVINVITSSIDSIDINRCASYQSKTHHIVTYNKKPLMRAQLLKITENL